MPQAQQVGDKFHVVKLLLDAVQSIRIRLNRQIETAKRKAYELFKKEEAERKKTLEESGKCDEYKKRKFEYNEEKMSNGETPSELLKRSRYLLYKYPDQLTQSQKQRAKVLFTEFSELESAYYLNCDFRDWYSRKNIAAPQLVLERRLHQWYEDVEKSGIEELMNFSSTVERNQEYICNYFHNGATNAIAENRNGRIKKFISLNQGTRDRDFFFFRLKKYYT
jgi:transposase